MEKSFNKLWQKHKLTFVDFQQVQMCFQKSNSLYSHLILNISHTQIFHRIFHKTDLMNFYLVNRIQIYIQ